MPRKIITVNSKQPSKPREFKAKPSQAPDVQTGYFIGKIRDKDTVEVTTNRGASYTGTVQAEDKFTILIIETDDSEVEHKRLLYKHAIETIVKVK